MDVKQGQNKEGKTVLYLVFEYMDTDLKKYIRSFRQSGDQIPVKTVKVSPISVSLFILFFLSFFVLDWVEDASMLTELDVPTLQRCCLLPRPWRFTQVNPPFPSSLFTFLLDQLLKPVSF